MEQNSLQAPQGPGYDAHGLSDFEERPRLYAQTGFDKRSNRSDFGVFDGNGSPARSQDLDHARHGQNREAKIDIEAAKHITGKKRNVHLSDAVRPASFHPIKRQKRLVALVSQHHCRSLFALRPRSYRKPPTVAITFRHNTSSVVKAPPRIVFLDQGSANLRAYKCDGHPSESAILSTQQRALSRLFADLVRPCARCPDRRAEEITHQTMLTRRPWRLGTTFPTSRPTDWLDCAAVNSGLLRKLDRFSGSGMPLRLEAAAAVV